MNLEAEKGQGLRSEFWIFPVFGVREGQRSQLSRLSLDSTQFTMIAYNEINCS